MGKLGVLGGNSQQVGRLLALLPERGPPVGATPRQEQGPGRALPEAGREHGRSRQLGDEEFVELVRIDDEVIDRELIDGFR